LETAFEPSTMLANQNTLTWWYKERGDRTDLHGFTLDLPGFLWHLVKGVVVLLLVSVMFNATFMGYQFFQSMPWMFRDGKRLPDWPKISG